MPWDQSRIVRVVLSAAKPAGMVHKGMCCAEGVARHGPRACWSRSWPHLLAPVILHPACPLFLPAGRGYMDVNRISGYLPGKMVFFLMQVSGLHPPCLPGARPYVQAHPPRVAPALQIPLAPPAALCASLRKWSPCRSSRACLPCPARPACQSSRPAALVAQVCRAGVGRPRKIWLTRHGESHFNTLGKIGGNSGLRCAPGPAALPPLSAAALLVHCPGLSVLACCAASLAVASLCVAPAPPLPATVCLLLPECSPRGHMYAELLPDILASRVPKTAEGTPYPVAGARLVG